MIFSSPKGDTKPERSSKSQSCAKISCEKFKLQIIILLMSKLQIHGEKTQEFLKQLLKNLLQELLSEKQQKSLFPVI